MNVAYEVVETRPGWERSLLARIFGPALALVVVIALLLIARWSCCVLERNVA